ncbi:rhodanese-like domain-containing protein [Euzebya tangerina]|uniref:rhodanese-like domain-containing protein n=1 Tax=Euzebya tangerina TaxID=591198 RepID=UPI000E3111B4
MIPEILPQAAADAVARGAVLLDVREPLEIATARVDGALEIPMGQIPARIEEIPTDAAILCLCHHGARSLQVAHFLHAQGYDVSNVRGGIDHWSQTVDPSIPRYV